RGAPADAEALEARRLTQGPPFRARFELFQVLAVHLRATATPKPGLARACAPDEPAKSAPPNGTLQRNALRRPRSRGGGPKQMRLRPCVHANSRQGLPIAVLSLFKGLAQETGLLWRPILSCSDR